MYVVHTMYTLFYFQFLFIVHLARGLITLDPDKEKYIDFFVFVEEVEEKEPI